MDKEKARAALAEALQPYRAKSYAALRDLIGQTDVYQIANPDGSDFQIEIEAFWDGKPDGDIRVMGGVDDGGFRSAFSPLSDDFVVAPDGSFVGE